MKLDRIQHTIHLRQLAIQRQQTGLHARRNPGFGNPDQLDPKAQLVGIGEINRRNIAYSLNRHRVKAWLLAKGDRPQQRQLMRRINAINVKRRLCLRIAQFLRIGQHVIKRFAGFLHPRQNVIAGAIQYP